MSHGYQSIYWNEDGMVGQCGGTKLFENYIVKVFGVSLSTVLVVLLACTTHLVGYVLP